MQPSQAPSSTPVTSRPSSPSAFTLLYPALPCPASPCPTSPYSSTLTHPQIPYILSRYSATPSLLAFTNFV
ncbi:hypothetical protein Pmani_011952 [Petrolisthes manimaculis]|uniref:Uncharacterized protein n=1 Tax=Petrolisthes manimaculis TaxID=1843537 RepID=A0AAE1UF48_9EUCA|nr:hypothetical protein Pmani_011952 [Petrolisthes manimaculis]